MTILVNLFMRSVNKCFYQGDIKYHITSNTIFSVANLSTIGSFIAENEPDLVHYLLVPHLLTMELSLANAMTKSTLGT